MQVSVLKNRAHKAPHGIVLSGTTTVRNICFDKLSESLMCSQRTTARGGRGRATRGIVGILDHGAWLEALRGWCACRVHEGNGNGQGKEAGSGSTAPALDKGLLLSANVMVDLEGREWDWLADFVVSVQDASSTPPNPDVQGWQLPLRSLYAVVPATDAISGLPCFFSCGACVAVYRCRRNKKASTRAAAASGLQGPRKCSPAADDLSFGRFIQLPIPWHGSADR
jgi:hypothetical protein